jgi:putative protease
MQMGTHQVSGMVTEEGNHFLCKYKTYPGDRVEIMAPLDAKIEEVDNEIGSVTKEGDTYYITFKKLIAENGKEWESVHSGNVNPIRLPIPLPSYTFLRIPATDEMTQIPKV